jgi:hypothetical protein
MATSPKASKSKPQGGSKRPDAYSYPLPVDLVRVAEPVEEDLMGLLGWVMAVILVALMLPLLAFMYLDVLETKAEAKAQMEKVEKLRREIERKNRDKEPAMFSDNPVFDRVRKPLSLRMSRSDKLE